MEELLSVIIIRCDTASDFAGSVESVLAQKHKGIECIAADAADGTAGGLIPDRAAFFDISRKIYENIAQVKNEAVKLASCRYALILTAGQKLDEGCLDKILDKIRRKSNSCEADSDELLKKYFSEGIGSVGYLAVDRESLGVVGGWNEKLPCAEDYELMIRACDFGCGGNFCAEASYEEPPVYRENFFVYGYLLGKYYFRLKSMNVFDEIFAGLYEQARRYGTEKYFGGCVKEMLSRGDAFEVVDREVRPVLIFTGEIECSGALASFAQELGSALRRNGQNVQIINLEGGETSELRAAASRNYRAVVGFQTAFFTEQLKSGELAGNIFKCPKFNYIFDHPLYLSYFLMLPVDDLYVLQQDETYAAYVKNYYPHIKNVWHFPPAGITGGRMRRELDGVLRAGDERAEAKASDFNAALGSLEKTMDISFVATYNDYRERMAVIRELPPDIRRLSLKMIRQLKNNPLQSAEEALSCVLKRDCREVSPREFVVLLHKSCEAVRAVSFYYREKTVRMLIEAGLKVDVFGEAWRKAPYADNPNLCIHGDVSFEEGLDVMAESRISLNVMTWHKGGMTERVANAMLNGSVCVTDNTIYIERNFKDGENIVIFELDNIEALPGKLKKLLAPENAEILNKLAVNAYEKALREHTWDTRAKQFLEILSGIEKPSERRL